MPNRSIGRSYWMLLVCFSLAPICVSRNASAEVLYGFTSTELIAFDSSSPGTFATVGAHGIAADVSIYNPTFDPGNGRVYAFGYHTAPGVTEILFLEYNLATGAGSTVTTLSQVAQQSYEALTYSTSLGAMIASQSSSGSNPTPRLGVLSRTGDFTLLSNTGLDNDMAAFDSTRGRLYTFDVQPTNRAFLVNPLSGGSSDAGAIPQTLGGVAYSMSDDAIYGIRSDTVGSPHSQLVRLATGTTFSAADLGSLALPLTGIFTIPSASSILLLGLGFLGGRSTRAECTR